MPDASPEDPGRRAAAPAPRACFRARGLPWIALVLALLALPEACEGKKGGEAGGEGGEAGEGAGGEGGCAPEAVARPLYTLSITAEGGVLPPDLSLEVTWSAGKEPPFLLDDPSTWTTLEDANVVCDVDPKKPAARPIERLRCELWTSGPTDVRVAGSGYETLETTLAPEVDPRCERPAPREVEVELERPRQDGGAP